MKYRFGLVFCTLAVLGIYGCDEVSAERTGDVDCGQPDETLICECVDGTWQNCKPISENKECKAADKPAGATGCTCNTSTGQWENCSITGENKECKEADKPADATGCTCNTSTGQWENCTMSGDPKECDEADKPADATGCTCNTSTGQWENCTMSGDPKECNEDDKPADATGCTCNTSTGQWENCTMSGDPKECDEADKPADATGCTCNTSTGQWENCTMSGDPKECNEDDKPANATGCECVEGEWENCVFVCADADKPVTATECECNPSNGNWENCVFQCIDDDKPAGVTQCECNQGVWENCTYPELSILTDKDTFTVSETKSSEKIGVRLSTCPLKPTTVTVETDNIDECALYDAENNSSGASYAIEFDGTNCEEYKKITIIGQDDNIDDDDVACKLTITASSEDTDVNTSYNGKTFEINGMNQDNDTAGITLKPNPIAIQEGGSGNYSGTIEVKLNSQPLSNVTVQVTATNAVASDTEKHLSLYDSQLVFTPENYNVTQGVPFNGVRDYIARAVAPVTVKGTASSSDAKYNKMSKTANVNVNNIDTAGAQITTSGTSLSEASTSTSQTVTITLTSKPTANVKVTATRQNNRIWVNNTNSSATNTSSTLTITPAQWNTGKKFYVFPVNDQIQNSNNKDKLTLTLQSSDPNYDGTSYQSSEFTVSDNDSATKNLSVSCSGTAGCTSVQGFAKCTFSLAAADWPADKTDVKITCTSPDYVIWVHDATLTYSGNYIISDVNAGGGKCGAAMEGDRFGTSTITCTGTTSSGFKATGSTSLKYSYHHSEWP